MLKEGYIAANSIYISYAHNEDIIEKYMVNVDQVFQLIASALDAGNIEDLLETPQRTDAFGRLTKWIC